MIYEWQPTPETHNLGDHCVQIIKNIFEDEALLRIETDPDTCYLLLGSALYNEFKAYSPTKYEIVANNYVFFGCGWRGEPLDKLCRYPIYGCRGEKTRAEFLKNGVNTPAIGDPALLLRLFFPKSAPSGEKLLVPHVSDSDSINYDARSFGCDRVVSPATTHLDSLETAIRQISGASFVLAGALHAAIIAYAFGVPFAYLRTDSIDCPAKWDDWNSSIGLGPAEFFSGARAGLLWFAQQQNKLKYVPLSPMLCEAAKIGRVRKEIWKKARLLDIAKKYRYADLEPIPIG